MSEANRPAVPLLLRNSKIAIIGAGPAGLTLARLLQMQGGDVTVFERDASRAVRGQGGSLDLHEDSGQLALREAGLFEAFKARIRPEGQRSRILDRHGTLVAELRAEDEAQARPEIDRGDLRDLLLDSLAPGTVVWNAGLRHVERAEAGGWRLVCEQGEGMNADLLFGCDGGWSKVRPLRSGLVPRYSGVTFVQAWISDADNRHPAVAAFTGPGNFMALGEDKALMAQRNGDGRIRVYAAVRVEEGWHERADYDWTDAGQVRADLLRHFDGWAESLTALLRHADPVFQPWPLYHFPANQTWRPEADVTLLGDAAHIMPPFTGRGANYAMLDALDVAQRLTSGHFGDTASALADYEKTMLARMAPAIEESLASQDLMIAPSAPEGMLTHIQRRTGR